MLTPARQRAETGYDMGACTRFFTQGIGMGNELFYLSLYGVLVLATVLAQVLAAVLQVGLPTLAGPERGCCSLALQVGQSALSTTPSWPWPWWRPPSLRSH